MYKKLVLTLIPLLLIASIAFSGLTFAQPTIKVGVIGPVGLPHWSPGMKEAAEMARDEINAAGGIKIGGTSYQIQLILGNEYAIDPETGTYNPTKARAELARLLDEGAKFIAGGFRTEVTGPIIEEAMDAKVPFFINGASTDELIPNMTNPALYARYKYLFRVNPINSTMLVRNIFGYLVYYLIPYKLLPMYGHPVKFAVLTEDLAWTAKMHYILTTPTIYPTVLGPNVTLAYQARIPETATDLSTYLNGVKDSGARLMIIVFSGRAGLPLIVQWASMGVQALPVGINVLGQIQTHWSVTGGKCAYEVIMNTLGTRTPIVPGVTDVFWDKFVTKTGGAWPMYTAIGAYDQLYALKETLEAAPSDVVKPYLDGTADADALIPYIAAHTRVGLTNRFKYTEWHDVFSVSAGPVWPDGYLRAMMVQWRKEKMEVVSPVDQLYSTKTVIPTWMYDLADVDLDFNGKVDIKDIFTIAKSFGASPGNPRWNIEADVNVDGKTDINDIFLIAKGFGKSAAQWPLP